MEDIHVVGELDTQKLYTRVFIVTSEEAEKHKATKEAPQYLNLCMQGHLIAGAMSACQILTLSVSNWLLHEFPIAIMFSDGMMDPYLYVFKQNKGRLKVK